MGGTAEVTWSIRNNHGGGYQYRCGGWLRGGCGCSHASAIRYGCCARAVARITVVPRSYHTGTTLVPPWCCHPRTVLPSGALSIQYRARLRREPRHAATPIHAYIGFAHFPTATSLTSPRSVRVTQELRHRFGPFLSRISQLYSHTTPRAPSYMPHLGAHADRMLLVCPIWFCPYMTHPSGFQQNPLDFVQDEQAIVFPNGTATSSSLPPVIPASPAVAGGSDQFPHRPAVAACAGVDMCAVPPLPPLPVHSLFAR